MTPEHLADVWPAADWDNKAPWSLDLPTTEMPIEDLAWILEHPVWSTEHPRSRFDLVPLRVFDDAEFHPQHARRIDAADVRFPLMVTRHRGRVVLDGLHRLAKLARAGTLTAMHPANPPAIRTARTSFQGPRVERPARVGSASSLVPHEDSGL